MPLSHMSPASFSTQDFKFDIVQGRYSTAIGHAKTDPTNISLQSSSRAGFKLHTYKTALENEKRALEDK